MLNAGELGAGNADGDSAVVCCGCCEGEGRSRKCKWSAGVHGRTLEPEVGARQPDVAWLGRTSATCGLHAAAKLCRGRPLKAEPFRPSGSRSQPDDAI